MISKIILPLASNNCCWAISFNKLKDLLICLYRFTSLSASQTCDPPSPPPHLSSLCHHFHTQTLTSKSSSCLHGFGERERQAIRRDIRRKKRQSVCSFYRKYMLHAAVLVKWTIKSWSLINLLHAHIHNRTLFSKDSLLPDVEVFVILHHLQHKVQLLCAGLRWNTIQIMWMH